MALARYLNIVLLHHSFGFSIRIWVATGSGLLHVSHDTVGKHVPVGALFQGAIIQILASNSVPYNVRPL